jgi:Phytanoyl-CoA dioxygenase (PhyH)
MVNKIKSRIFELKSELAYRVALSNHAKNLPTLGNTDSAILDTLKHEGVCVTSLAALGLESTPQLLSESYNQLAAMPAPKTTGRKLPQIYTVTDLPAFSHWGSEQRLLNIIENYIGLPVAFHGVHLRKDFPNENQFGTLLWHKDAEDRRIIKVIVYLSDVEPQQGPFEYVPKSLNNLYNLNYYRTYYKLWQSGYLGISDDTLEKIIPKAAWKPCPGKAGTVILVDTKNVLHHGTIRSEERSTLFFVYTANPPKRPQDCTQYWDDTFPRLTCAVSNAEVV